MLESAMNSFFKNHAFSENYRFFKVLKFSQNLTYLFCFGILAKQENPVSLDLP